MSTQKNEHNPDNLTPEQVGEGWRLLTKGEVQEIGDEWWYGGEWCPVHRDNVGRHYEFTTTRRRITPPTETTGKPDCARCFGYGWISRPVEGVRCDCCPDTTGSGREGETPTPETDANALESRKYVGKGADFVSLDFARQLECERDAALAQVEALRRKLECYNAIAENGWDIAKRRGVWNVLDVGIGMQTGIGHGETLDEAVRAAIDSAQRQEKP